MVRVVDSVYWRQSQIIYKASNVQIREPRISATSDVILTR